MPRSEIAKILEAVPAVRLRNYLGNYIETLLNHFVGIGRVYPMLDCLVAQLKLDVGSCPP